MSETTPTPPHAPKLGIGAKLLGPLHFSSPFWINFLRRGATLFPDWLKPAVIVCIGGLFLPFISNIRRALSSNLSPVLGKTSWWGRLKRSFRSLYQFAWIQMERFEWLAEHGEFDVSIQDRTHWNRMTSSPKGAVLATGHLGNWELGAAIANMHDGRELHLVREQELNPKTQSIIQEEMRGRFGRYVVTHFASGELSLGVTLLKALQDGHLVALQGDRPRSNGRSIEVSLFGKPFPLPVGLFAIARTAKVSIYPCFVVRTGRRQYQAIIPEPIEIQTTNDRNQDIKMAAQALAGRLETVIKAYPYQWFCFRELWPESDEQK